MTTFSLPWTSAEPGQPVRHRKQAIGGLIGTGFLLMLLGGANVKLLDFFRSDVDTVVFVLACIFPLLGGLTLPLIGLLTQNPLWFLVAGAIGTMAVANGIILKATPFDPYVFGFITQVIVNILVGGLLMTAGLVVLFYRQITWILRLRYVPLMIFLTAVAAIPLIVWAHALLFDFSDALIHDAGVNNPAKVSFAGGELTVEEFQLGIPERLAPLGYALWPLQFALVRDVIALGAIIGFISIIPGFGIWWERKIAGRIQSRLGPMRVGGWHGWAQSAADGIKLIFKEDLIPPGGDPLLFRLAPYFALVPPVCAFLALPFAAAYVFRDLDVALLFILAMLGLEVLGTILAGWASNNKWSIYGAMREACQMVSYEIPMGMALLIPVMTVGSLQLTAISDAQSGGFADWLVFANPWCFCAFFIYFTASLASCKRAPFDLPESESELVAGFLTEYSGFRWSLFFFGEYAAMFIVAGLATILFLGGWKSPFPADWAPVIPATAAWNEYIGERMIRGLFFDGPILFILKSAFLFYVQMWVRWTLPRIRIDQMLYACVQVLLPMTMVILLANTLWMYWINKEVGIVVAANAFLHWLLVMVGVSLIVGMLFIATYGYIHRRRLPGPLVIEHLPGA